MGKQTFFRRIFTPKAKRCYINHLCFHCMHSFVVAIVGNDRLCYSVPQNGCLVFVTFIKLK